MPSTPATSPKETTTLREMMKSYLPSPERVSEDTHAGVKVIRQLARQVLQENEDIADVEFDADKVHEVGRGIFEFVNGDFTRAMNQAEAAKKGELTESDLVRLIPDGIGRQLANDVRSRILEAL